MDQDDLDDNNPKNKLVQNKGSMRQQRDAKAKTSNHAQQLLQLPKDTSTAKAGAKKQKNDKGSKTANVTAGHSNDQTEQFATESNLEMTSAGGKGAKKKRDKKQEQKLTEKSRDEESIRDKSKKHKKDKRQDKKGDDKKSKAKSKNSDSDKTGKDTKKQKTIFVQPGQTNPLKMNVFPMGLPLGQGLGGIPPLGMIPPMMGGMNHPMGGIGGQLAMRAHQMLQLQMAAASKLKNTSKPGNSKAVPSLNLFKGMNNMVGMKRPAIPLAPLNLLGDLMGKKDAGSQKRATDISQDQSSSKISVSDNNSANEAAPAPKSSQEPDQ